MKVPRWLATALHDGVALEGIREAAAEVGLDESVVLEAARVVGRDVTIFESESARPSLPSKGTTVREIKDLKRPDLLRIRAFKAEGRKPGDVAAAFGISEADMSILYEALESDLTAAQAATDAANATAANTDFDARAVSGRRQLDAQVTMARANAAESKGLERASLQELHALAALSVPR